MQQELYGKPLLTISRPKKVVTRLIRRTSETLEVPYISSDTLMFSYKSFCLASKKNHSITHKFSNYLLGGNIYKKENTYINNAITNEIKRGIAPQIIQFKIPPVFRTITSDNGLEFAELSALEKDTDIKVYFTHPYYSHERELTNAILV